MIATASRVSVKAGIGFNMPLDWHVMVTLGVVMIAIFGYIRFAVFNEVRRAAAAREWPAAGRGARPHPHAGARQSRARGHHRRRDATRRGRLSAC
jgi:hypothetical protein